MKMIKTLGFISRRANWQGIFINNVRCSSSGADMLAWQIHQYGGINEYTLSKCAKDRTIRSPDELLIKVHAASLNPIDLWMMGGYGRVLINTLRNQKDVMRFGTEFPLTLGRDFSGTVIEIGQKVHRYKIGDEVWGALGAEKQGTHAQYVVASQCEISKKPKNISHIEAASMPYVATTTWAALCTIGHLKEHNAAGKRILILGGSGGVGTFAIQLVKAWGMHVTTTCSSTATDLVTKLGADEVIDYKSHDVWKVLKSCEKFDIILDTLGGEYTDKATNFLRPWQNSKLITLVIPFLKNSDSLGLLPGLVKSAFSAGCDTVKGLKTGVSVRWAVFMPNGAAMDKVRRMVENEQIKPVVHESYTFNNIPGAFERLQEGHMRGKIVTDVLSDM